jgi:hypothetical protein
MLFALVEKSDKEIDKKMERESEKINLVVFKECKIRKKVQN